MSNYKIEKNIPIPVGAGTRGPSYKYPWRDMNVGDSIFIPDMTVYQINPHNAAKKYNQKFSARTVDGGVRVWRIK